MDNFNPSNYTRDELDTVLDLLTMLEKYARNATSVAEVLHLLHDVKMGVFKESFKKEDELYREAFDRIYNPPV